MYYSGYILDDARDQRRNCNLELGWKEKTRTQVLFMYLREAYAVFKKTVADGEFCSFSAFRKLRPKNVLLLVDTPKEQCKLR